MPRWIHYIKWRLDGENWQIRGLGFATSGGNMPINPTDGVVPYRIDGTTFGDSQILRRNDSTIDQRNISDGTIAQQWRIYNSSDNGIGTPTNFERFVIQYNSSDEVWRLTTQAGGTGVTRDVVFFNVKLGITPDNFPMDAQLQIGYGGDANRIGIRIEGTSGQIGNFFELTDGDNGGNMFEFRGNGILSLGTNAARKGQLLFNNANNAEATVIEAGDTPASTVVYRWPADDPAVNEVLTVASFAAGVATLQWSGIAAAGSDTQLQRNNGGVLGGISGATSDGTNVTFGDGNLRATSPLITTGIDDANGNQIIGFTATASAVTYVRVTNNSTGNAPSIAADGETNVQLTVASKGSSNLQLNGGSTGQIRFGGNLSATITDDGSGNTNIKLGAGGRFVWSNDNNPNNGSVVLRLIQAGNGIMRVASNNDGIGAILGGYYVDPRTAATVNLDTEDDSGKLFTNEGTTALVNFNLPAAAANNPGGALYMFHVQDTDGITVTAAAGDTIRIGASVSATGGNISTTTRGNSIILIAINATEWVALSVVGTWTVT